MTPNAAEQIRHCSTAEAANRLGVSTSTIRTMIRDERLMADCHHGCWQVRISSIEARLAAQRRDQDRRSEGRTDDGNNDHPAADYVPAEAQRESGLSELIRAVLGEDRLLLTSAETATVLGLRPRVVQDSINLGQIPSRKICGTKFVPVAALEEWLHLGDVA